jgi:DNA polymerase III epsilon subunit family exonuclease
MEVRIGVDGHAGEKRNRYVVLDIETTGLLAEKDRIIEIGAVAVCGDAMEEEFQSLICTERPIRRQAGKVHGITAEILDGQPKPAEVLTAFREFFGGSTLVAHNADFDVWFLRYEYWRLEHTLINPCKHKARWFVRTPVKRPYHVKKFFQHPSVTYAA